MQKRNIEDGLALAGAILVIVGVSFAATSALADGNDVVTTAVAIHDAAETSATNAATAHTEAADAAVARMARSNELDLDIRLIDHK